MPREAASTSPLKFCTKQLKNLPPIPVTSMLHANLYQLTAMTISIENRSITFGNAAIAYLLSVTAAAGAYAILMEGTQLLVTSGLMQNMTNSGCEGSSTSWRDAFFIFIFGWIIAFITTIIPYAIGIHAINKFKAYCWQSFVGGSTVTAAMLGLLYEILMHNSILFRFSDIAFWVRILTELLRVVIAGATAGTICWLFLENNPFKLFGLQQPQQS